MAANPPSLKVRHRTLDRLRQKLWAVPAHMRLRLVQRSPAAKPRVYRPADPR
jgi:hypothetical protein